MSDSAMTEEKGLLAALDCPFCGASLKKYGSHWFHLGVVTDDDCLMSGKGFADSLALWNRRARPVAPASAVEALREAREWLAEFGNMADGNGSRCARLMRNLVAALTAQAHPAGDDGELNIAETDDHEGLARYWHQEAMKARAALSTTGTSQDQGE